jgi:hypothetical protein
MISFHHSGNFKNTERFFDGATKAIYFYILDKYGQIGVNALASATPVDSGETAHSWSYDVTHTKNKAVISWSNSHKLDKGNVPVAIVLQYGHGTGTGGFVQGRDYINPAIRPIFDKMADDVWKVVTSL